MKVQTYAVSTMNIVTDMYVSLSKLNEQMRTKVGKMIKWRDVSRPNNEAKNKDMIKSNILFHSDTQIDAAYVLLKFHIL